MRQFHRGAFKHGVSKADLSHVLKHPMRVMPQEDGSCLYLGAGRNGVLLEVVTIPATDGSELAVHAMKMRPRYANLLPRE
jgi:hypothetical protein